MQDKYAEQERERREAEARARQRAAAQQAACKHARAREQQRERKVQEQQEVERLVARALQVCGVWSGLCSLGLLVAFYACRKLLFWPG